MEHLFKPAFRRILNWLLVIDENHPLGVIHGVSQLLTFENTNTFSIVAPPLSLLAGQWRNAL
jgi:hypothetical protein